MSANTYAEVRAMSREELVEAHDRLAGTTVLGLGFYREEIARREAEAANERIERMTRTILVLTWFIALLTVANVVLVACSLFAG